MGQKTHPKFFRLGISQTHSSTWYSTKLEYKHHIEEDFLIRKKINDLLEDILIISQIDISRLIKIKKENSCVYLNINAQLISQDNIIKQIIELFDIESNELNKLKNENKMKIISILIKYKLKNLIRVLQYKYQSNFYISIKLFKYPFEDAILFAKYIGVKLQKRIPFRRIFIDAFKKIQPINEIKGLKIQISGRINGQDMARTEWKREGKIPLHTLNLKIDYAFYPIKTVYGLMGIKIWLYKKLKS